MIEIEFSPPENICLKRRIILTEKELVTLVMPFINFQSQIRLLFANELLKRKFHSLNMKSFEEKKSREICLVLFIFNLQ